MYLPEVKQALQLLETRGVQPDTPMNSAQIECMNSLITFLRGTLSDDPVEQDIHSLLAGVGLLLKELHNTATQVEWEDFPWGNR